MTRLLKITILALAIALSAHAHNDNGEREIKSLLAEYEQAILKRDVAFMERVLTDDYTYSAANGTKENLTQVLSYWKQERDKPTYKIISYKRDDVSMRVMGNTAVVTEAWTYQTTPVDSTSQEPRIDKGISTIVLNKRNGRWTIVAEHESEQPRDRKMAEQQILKAGRDYNELMKRLKSGRDYADLVKQGEIKALERLLADEYTYTSRDGEIFTKAEDLESYKANKIKIESAEILEQKVRVVGNAAAVETGLIRYVGTNDGNPFDMTKRYTTTWVLRAYRWQIVADHTSAVK